MTDEPKKQKLDPVVLVLIIFAFLMTFFIVGMALFDDGGPFEQKPTPQVESTTIPSKN